MSLYMQLRSSVSYMAVCFYWNKKQEELAMDKAVPPVATQKQFEFFLSATHSSYVRPLTEDELVTACQQNPGEAWRFAICNAVSGEQQGIGTDLDTILSSAKKSGIDIHLCH